MARPSPVRIPALSLVLLAVAAPWLSACGAGDDPGTSPPTATRSQVAAGALPTSYRFVLHASCGERRLAGEYHLVVRDGRVVDAGPTRLVRFTHLRLSDFPTLADLLAKADHAEPDAVVDLHVDDSGIPSYLSIDHDPAAIDDEECYRVTGVRRLGE
jgi:hypothetical protein